MPPFSVQRRDVAVAVVAAAFGGSVVAGAFAAASFLSRPQSNGYPRASVACDDADSNVILAWIRQLFGRVSAMLEQRDAAGSVERIGGTPNAGHCSGSGKVDPFNPSKRKGYLSWNDYFMAIAFLSAQRSKDPNRQVGACLVSQDQVILGIGYNGFPRGCSDDELPWAKISVDGDPLKTKYPYVCHAEVNAIMNKNHASAAGQRLYVTMFPCNECAKVIIQARIAEVIYFTEKGQTQSKNWQETSFLASRRLLAMAGVKVWQYKPLQQGLALQYR
ncbi:unnamed protein product [Calypogeia fissa]